MMIAAAAAATTPEDKGFNFDSMNDDFPHGDTNNEDYDDNDLAIDADFFFTILDEDLPQLPNDPFYLSTDNTQESGSAVHAGNNEDLLFSSGYGSASQNSAETVEALEQLPCASPPDLLLTKANEPSLEKSNTEFGLHHSPNFMEESFASTQDWFSIYKMSAGPLNQSLFDGVNYGLMSSNGAIKSSMEGSSDDARSCHPWVDNNTGLEGQVGPANVTASEVPMYDFFYGKGNESMLHDSFSIEHVDTINAFDSSSSTTTDEGTAEQVCWGLTDRSCAKQAELKDEMDNGLSLLNGIEGKSSKVNTENEFGRFSFGLGTGNFLASPDANYCGAVAGIPAVYSQSPSIDRKRTNLPLLEDPASSISPYATFGSSCYKMESGEAVVRPANVKPVPLKGTHKACQGNLSEDRSDNEVDDDDDVCILEDMSVPSRVHQFSAYRKSVSPQLPTFTPQCSPSALRTPFLQMGVNGTRSKATDERLIFQAVVQDLSQPKLEATPPDGVLAVPLLRHQRIALSWMVKKETSLQCSGGILADDQGLGKTVSTIALILSERAPTARTLKGAEQGKLETLDLDKEDDKQARTAVSMNSVETSFVRGRPSAGTLIVCPTSVLRQWAEELQNKVTSEANLSVCVYHGSNRTKDPYELAKYDVVLTTYSIVSMEVPKQPVFDKDGNDKRKLQIDDACTSSNRKRKHSPAADKRHLKREMDKGLIESVALPLAKVVWFRVVLDEAQSIKNHRTRVAQACWGLRAKRRWCLSGTPIQNAVDDLYSYFRFLRYDPYSVYKHFCSMVKLQIAKNPSTGYKKLQVVLKNIMLRRTKGTLLDGEPIINLPPKSVNLKKVDFSEEERDFYSRLEAESRAQFQAYAASGTVKQNYVNILLMLLRLRQACDHPLLVQGYDSSSVLNSSIHVAKKLTRERQISLLNCLEASLAICGICRDPPEDAVVSICGHVFCNQCICEHLTGDDIQCPVTICKEQLSVSLVFAKGTLKRCLSDQSYQDGSHICSASESSDQGELVEPLMPSCSASSKLKAALEVLQSLSKPQTTMRSVNTNDGLLDKPVSTSCAPVNESSIVSNGSANINSGVTEKAIVFSQWTRMLDLLEDCLKETSIQYRRLDGTMSVVARDKAVKDFNTVPEISVMIMSLKAASLGLNMVAACHVLLLDLWWNPTTEDQAIDRAHRIGQTRPVTVVRLTVKDTVEDRILALQQKKRELVASAFGEDESGSRQTRLTVEDLKYLFMA